MARDLGFTSTDGDKYYFLSYNAEDATRISPLVLKIHNADVPLWYDDGIEYGEKWEEIIGERILNSVAMIFFFSVGILQKEDSYALKEYRIAKHLKKDIYIILIDKIESKLWTLYPKRAAFLDDVEQTHFPNDVDLLISRLKKDEHITSSNISVDQHIIPSVKKITIEGTKIVDSEYLLNNGLCSSLEISKRHVDLDYLAVDAKLFPGAIDVEGDAETWEDMITATADCSANLIVNNSIVGYMDFLPVTPEDYIRLQTEPFNDSYVAFYAFGGRFDIFGSMFSIDPNYATPTNYILFMKWMIERILMWKKNDIHIGKIEFSIYSKQQAKALEKLGFKLILTNDLKGMLYEIRVEDLLNSQSTKNWFKEVDLTTYTYHMYDTSEASIVNQCLEIAFSLSVRNGGILQYEDAPKEADYIIAAIYNSEVAGYLCLKKYNSIPNGIYLEQIAIKENHQHLGVGRNLIKQMIRYAKENQYTSIVANCKKINKASYALLTKMGFIVFDMSVEQYDDIGIARVDIEKNYALILKL